MIFYARITNFNEFKRLADNRDKYRNYGILQDQPYGC